jgi:hypothetical protein
MGQQQPVLARRQPELGAVRRQQRKTAEDLQSILRHAASTKRRSRGDFTEFSRKVPPLAPRRAGLFAAGSRPRATLSPDEDREERAMRGALMRVRQLVWRLTRPEPVARAARADGDWMPPVLDITDLSSPYFLAMADRETAWYFDRR